MADTTGDDVVSLDTNKDICDSQSDADSNAAATNGTADCQTEPSSVGVSSPSSTTMDSSVSSCSNSVTDDTKKDDKSPTQSPSDESRSLRRTPIVAKPTLFASSFTVCSPTVSTNSKPPAFFASRLNFLPTPDAGASSSSSSLSTHRNSAASGRPVLRPSQLASPGSTSEAATSPFSSSLSTAAASSSSSLRTNSPFVLKAPTLFANPFASSSDVKQDGQTEEQNSAEAEPLCTQEKASSSLANNSNVQDTATTNFDSVTSSSSPTPPSSLTAAATTSSTLPIPSSSSSSSSCPRSNPTTTTTTPSQLMAFVPLGAPAPSPSSSQSAVVAGQSAVSRSAVTPSTASASSSSSSSTAASSSRFVFGQNLHERVIVESSSSGSCVESSSSSSSAGASSSEAAAANASGEAAAVASGSCSASAATTNGTSSSSEMLFSSVLQKEMPDRSQDGSVVEEKSKKSLSEAAREYEESRAAFKRKYEEVAVVTGEEQENNILQMDCKLFVYDNNKLNYSEGVHGMLRVNDPPHCAAKKTSAQSSRVIVRMSGSLRVLLNTKIWAGMKIEKPNRKIVRMTAMDTNGQIKIFLISSSPSESEMLFRVLDTRIKQQKETTGNCQNGNAVAVQSTNAEECTSSSSPS